MRIGIDASCLTNQPTGIGTYLFYLLLPLCELRKGDDFFLYAHHPSDMLNQLSSLSNVTIKIDSFLSFSEAIWSQTTLAYLAYRDHLDLFWGVTQSLPLFTRKKQRNLLSVHDFAYLLYPKTVSVGRRIYLQLFSRWIIKKAHALFSISHGTEKKLHTFYKRASYVLQPPLKPTLHFHSKEKVIPYLKKWALLYKKYVIMLGTIEPRKNVLPTLRAYRVVKQTLLPIVLVGKRGWYRPEEIREIEKNRIIELGYLSDEELSYLLSGARYLLMPSLYEGYGMGIKEARSLHCPVICSDVEEMREAAEGDALVVRLDHLQEDLSNHLSRRDEGPSQISTSYPSNQQLAHSLSDQFNTICK
jgi:glycosyltransferase involved in cell wall biosynthesis